MSQALRAGSTVSHYRVVSAIGAGGMGEVYKAVDDNLERPVALKVLPPDLVRNDDRVRRFVQEAKSASALSHPHILHLRPHLHLGLGYSRVLDRPVYPSVKENTHANLEK